jgi:hypothetical protein
MTDLMGYLHKISEYSPLRLDISAGYKLLSLISKVQLDSVQSISLPEFETYVFNSNYSSEFLHNSQPLSIFMESDFNCVESAFNCVESFSKSMYRLRSSVDFEVVNKLCFYQETIQEIACRDFSTADFHCEKCKINIESLLKINLTQADFMTFADSILHGDLHGNNLISDGGLFKVVDLENVHLGPAYSDVILFSMLVRGAHSHLANVLSNMRFVIEREVLFSADVRHALCISFIQYLRATGDIKTIVMESVHETFNQLNALYPP